MERKLKGKSKQKALYREEDVWSPITMHSRQKLLENSQFSS